MCILYTYNEFFILCFLLRLRINVKIGSAWGPFGVCGVFCRPYAGPQQQAVVLQLPKDHSAASHKEASISTWGVFTRAFTSCALGVVVDPCCFHEGGRARILSTLLRWFTKRGTAVSGQINHGHVPYSVAFRRRDMDHTPL